MVPTAVAIDIAVDPLEGTNLVAHGQNGAITVLAASEAGGLLHAPDTYLDKLCVGPVAAGHVDIRQSPTENVRAIAAALRRDVRDITIVILERPRHEALIEEVRVAGARIKLITDGDLSAAISCAVSGTGVHGVLGIGGAPEGVITAAALKCLGGEIQARFRFRNDEERARAERMGAITDEEHVFTTEELAPGEDLVFAATGVTGGDLLDGGALLRRRRPHELAGDGLPVQGGALPGHGPHVRPDPAAGCPAVGESSEPRQPTTHVPSLGVPRAPPRARRPSLPSRRARASAVATSHAPAWRHEPRHQVGERRQHERALRRRPGAAPPATGRPHAPGRRCGPGSGVRCAAGAARTRAGPGPARGDPSGRAAAARTSAPGP